MDEKAITVLVHPAAFERVRQRLAVYGSRVRCVVLGVDGDLRDAVSHVKHQGSSPDAVWLSLDSHGDGQFARLTDHCLKAEPPPLWIQTFNAGLDNPVYGKLLARGTAIAKSSAQASAIAEYVIAHAFSLFVPVDAQREQQRTKVWKATPFREIAGTRWTIVGFGSIAQEIARRIRPFGVHITVARRSRKQDPLADEVVDIAGLPPVLGRSDVVILACPLNDETRNLVSGKFIAALKEGSILINVARGKLVDEDALLAGLEQQRPAHAVLDVFMTEPLPVEHWAWTHPQVRVSSHTSNAGDRVSLRGDESFLENLARHFRGEPLLNEVRGPASE